MMPLVEANFRLRTGPGDQSEPSLSMGSEPRSPAVDRDAGGSMSCRAGSAWRSRVGEACGGDYSVASRNDRTNPAVVLRATRGPPFSYASGISVSANDASTAPAAKANGSEMVVGSVADSGPAPTTTAIARSTPAVVHVPSTNAGERPCARIE